MNLLLFKAEHLNLTVRTVFKLGGGYSTVHITILFLTTARSYFSCCCGYVL